LFFIVDMILSSFGKGDYFMGNMFLLDAFSSLTMLLDFSFIDIAGLDKKSIDNFRSARTARLGVRASRIVWTIRQLRCYKVCKAKFSSSQPDLFSQEMMSITGSVNGKTDPGEAMPEEDAQTEGLMTQSNVGRSLSELTVCRVIAVVLAMVVILPFMQLSENIQLPTTAEYGSDVVLGTLKKLQQNPSEVNRVAFENATLRHVYYHNWFTHKTGCGERSCPADYYQSVFWFGLAGWASASETGESMLNLVQLRNRSVEAFESTVLSRSTFFDYGAMPAVARTALSSPWSTGCDDDRLKGISLVGQQIPGLVDYPLACPDDLRTRERTRHAPRFRPTHDDNTALYIVFYTDDRPFTRDSAKFNIIGTCFICFMLCVASMFITSDANDIILRPLESMMLKVNLIKINPLMAKELQNDAMRCEEVEKEINLRGSTSGEQLGDLSGSTMMGRALTVLTPKKKKKEPTKVNQAMETRILENTIIKLGMLLMLGFGEGGVHIVARNMGSDDSEWVDGKVEARAWVNGMLPGQRVDCLIGISRIGDFELITEVLQCEIMSFVNRVAEIVHGAVDSFHGSPNKVSDGVFLIIWPTGGLDNANRAKMCDMAVIAFVRIFAAVHSSRMLYGYKKHPGLQQKLLKHCRVNLTSGLHCGWAIEGAVGTEFKIDACYISQNVSLTESIENACEIYGAHFCLSGSVLENCTPEMAQVPRLIDRVQFQKGGKIVDLYCVDMNGAPIKIEPVIQEKFTAASWNSRGRFKYRQQLEVEKRRKLHVEQSVFKYLSKGSGMDAMRKLFTEEFVQIFKMGFRNYIDGEWGAARRWLGRSRHMLGFEDGPSAALIDLMEVLAPEEAEAPADWKGVHSPANMPKRTPTYASLSRKSRLFGDKVQLVMELNKLVAAGTSKVKFKTKASFEEAKPLKEEVLAMNPQRSTGYEPIMNPPDSALSSQGKVKGKMVPKKKNVLAPKAKKAVAGEPSPSVLGRKTSGIAPESISLLENMSAVGSFSGDTPDVAESGISPSKVSLGSTGSTLGCESSEADISSPAAKPKRFKKRQAPLDPKSPSATELLIASEPATSVGRKALLAPTVADHRTTERRRSKTPGSSAADSPTRIRSSANQGETAVGATNSDAAGVGLLAAPGDASPKARFRRSRQPK